MFKLQEKSRVYKNKAWLVSTSKQNFLYLNEEKYLVGNCLNSEIFVPFEPNRIILKDKVVLILDESNRAFVLDYVDNEFDDLGFAKDEKLLYEQNLNSNELIYRKEASLLIVQFGLLSTKSKEKKIISDFFPKYFFKHYIFGSNNDQIVRYDNYQSLWIYKLVGFDTFTNSWQEEKTYEVKKFVGVWHEQLIVQLTGGKFIGLNIENGDLLWDIDKVIHNKTHQHIDYGFGDPYNPFLDEEKGHVYILQGEDFIDFDLNKLEATYLWNVKDNTPENYPFIRQSRILDGKIYFTARSSLKASNDNMVGIFDIEKKEIIWQHIFEFEKGVFIPNSQDNIQVNDKNLLVLDSSGILHIFEREVKPIN